MSPSSAAERSARASRSSSVGLPVIGRAPAALNATLATGHELGCQRGELD
jgi:hypothetical protein